MDVDDEREICAFRAGRMTFADKKLAADPRKGQFRVAEISGLVHIQWFERKEDGSLSADAEEDQVVFEGEAQIEMINSSARVFAVKFAEDKSRNVFFWMQEPESARDPNLLAVAKYGIGAPGAAEPAQAFQSTPAPATGVQQTPGAPIRPAAPPSAPESSSRGPARLEGLDRLMEALQRSRDPSTSHDPRTLDPAVLLGRRGLHGGEPKHRLPTLGELLRPEILRPVLGDPAVQARLAEFMPPEHRTPHHFSELASSAQLRHQMDQLSAAISQGTVSATQFGLKYKGPTLADFLESVMDAVEEEKKRGEGGQQGQ